MSFEIELIETLVVRLPPRIDFRWLSLSRPLGEFVLVRVVASGAEGWGEVVGLRDWGDVDGRRHGETPATICAIVHQQLAPELLGVELMLGEIGQRLDAIVVGNPYAKALLDIAVHDLSGRVYGVPVTELLGGAVRTRLPVAHMLGIMPDDQAMDEARTAVADGVRALQIKGGVDIERDVALVRGLREELGEDVMLRLDANGGYATRPAARRALTELADAGIDLVEQPLLGIARLVEARRSSPVPIMADEACWSPADALELVAAGAVDALSVYVGKAGGLGRARSICAVAAAAGLPHDLNGALELGIGNAANLQLALASPADVLPSVVPVNAPAGMGLTQSAGRYFDDDVIVAPFRFEAGELIAPGTPGLGIDVDVEKVEHYCVQRETSAARAGVSR